MVVQIYTAEYI